MADRGNAIHLKDCARAIMVAYRAWWNGFVCLVLSAMSRRLCIEASCSPRIAL